MEAAIADADGASMSTVNLQLQTASRLLLEAAELAGLAGGHEHVRGILAIAVELEEIASPGSHSARQMAAAVEAALAALQRSIQPDEKEEGVGARPVGRADGLGGHSHETTAR